MKPPKHILISRTDAIGDVVLTIPMASYLKNTFKDLKISFLAADYTIPVVELSSHIDQVISYNYLKSMDDLERRNFIKSLEIDTVIHVYPRKDVATWFRQAAVKIRIGTSHRAFNWMNCNRLVGFSRKKSALHESQLNFKLLREIGVKHIPSLDEIAGFYGFNFNENLGETSKYLDANPGKNVVLHPLSKGSAREWGLDNFVELSRILIESGFTVFLTGTEHEGKNFRKHFDLENKKLVDLSGKLNLSQLATFISKADYLVAASTGPLHIAAAAGIRAIGIYPPIKPMHPARWAPVGINATYIVKDKECNECRKKTGCACMLEIAPEQVAERIMAF